MNYTLLKRNQWCINYEYLVGQQVLKYDNSIKRKLSIKILSPFMIVHIHVNGTITIQLQVDMTEQINICCTIPFKEPLL